MSYLGDALTRHSPVVATFGFPDSSVPAVVEEVMARATFVVRGRKKQSGWRGFRLPELPFGKKMGVALGAAVCVVAGLVKAMRDHKTVVKVPCLLEAGAAEEVTAELCVMVEEDDEVEGQFPVEVVVGEGGKVQEFDYNFAAMPLAKVGAYTAKITQAAKAHFGLLTRTEANRLMVQGWIAKEAKVHGVRPSHIVRILPMATSMVFVATIWDVAAKRMEATQLVSERGQMAGTWARRVTQPWWKFWAKDIVRGVEFTK